MTLDLCNTVLTPGPCLIVVTQGYLVSGDEVAMLNRVASYLMTTALPSDLDHKVLGVDVIQSFYGHTVSSWTSSDYLNAITMRT